jgi:hypothetical protein
MCSAQVMKDFSGTERANTVGSSSGNLPSKKHIGSIMRHACGVAYLIFLSFLVDFPFSGA